MSDENSKYDMMMSFFGLPGDRRVRLYMHALKGAFDKGEELILTNKMEQLKNNNFANPHLGLQGDDIHPEWCDFKSDMLVPKSIDLNYLLNIVRQHAGSAQSGSDKRFIQDVMKAHVIITDTTNQNITDHPLAWTSAVAVNYDLTKIQRIFSNVSNGIANSNSKNFNYKLTKFILHQLLEQAAEPRTHGVDNFWTSNEQEKDSYFRLTSNRNSLFTTDANGNRVDVSRGSDAYNNLANDSCIGTKVKQHDTLTCNNYITKCIKGNSSDIAACKEFMQDKSFWDVVPKEVDEMIPSIVEDTLNSFGFKIVSKNNLKEYESIGSWSRGLNNKGLNDNEIKQIRNNTKLTQYLQMLVTKINSNPAILNKQHNANYAFDPVDHLNHFASWTLAARGIRPRVILRKNKNQQINIVREIGLINSSLLNIRSLVNNRVSFIPGSGLVIRGIPVSVGSPIVFGQIGGSTIRMVSAVSNDDEIRDHYPLIKNLLVASEKMLNAKGKDFDANTKIQIEKHLESYRNSENKLIKAIRYADKYIDLLDIYKEYDHEEVLSMDHLKSFVDARERYFDKTIGKQNDLLSAIERIATTVSESIDKQLEES